MHYSIESDRAVDMGLACLVILARFHGLPVDPDHLSHQRGTFEPFTVRDIVFSPKSLGLKSCSVNSQ
jgi:subfamily B ATP-binding cassette protein HlyB/CyaB